MKITMAHGSGGGATRDLISKLFQKHLSNTYLDQMDDAAVLPPLTSPLAFTTDSYVITPLFFPGGDIGKLAVCGTANDLWMMGAEPKYCTAGFILEEGLELETLARVVRSLGEAAAAAGIKVVAGDTKVIEGNGGLYINTAGIGQLIYGREIKGSLAQPGDKLLISGPLGNHQACIMSQRMNIKNSIQSDCACLGELVRPLLELELKIHVLRDITRGGLATVTNEIAAASGVEIEMWESTLPVDPEVRGFSDVLGLDPLYMANEGKFICLIAPEDARRALSSLKEHPLGSKAQIIGEVKARSNRPRVVVTTRLGGKRILDVLYGEGLPRIC